MYSIINWQPLTTLPSDYDDYFIIAKIKDNEIQALYTAVMGKLNNTDELYVKVPLANIGIPFEAINSISLNPDGEGMVWSPIPDSIYSKQ